MLPMFLAVVDQTIVAFDAVGQQEMATGVFWPLQQFPACVNKITQPL
jgi:hypothetical protein